MAISKREELSGILKQREDAQKAEAVEWARKRGMPAKGPGFEIQKIEDGRPVYRTTN